MNIAIGLALLLVAVGNAQSQCDPPTDGRQCPIHTLQCCDGNFQDALNLTSLCGGTPTFSDPFCLRRSIEKLYELGGTNGLLKVCSAFFVYDACLGIAEQACTDILFFLQQGVKPFVAEEFVRLFASFHFACGGGLNAYLQNDACMANVFQTQNSTLKQCRDQFFNDIQQAPQFACGYFTDLIHCYQAPFTRMCGGEAGYWACEYERTAVSVFLPQCVANCGMTQSGSIG